MISQAGTCDLEARAWQVAVGEHAPLPALLVGERCAEVPFDDDRLDLRAAQLPAEVRVLGRTPKGLVLGEYWSWSSASALMLRKTKSFILLASAPL